MLKVLLKKQFLELNRACFQNRKTGKRRSKAGIVGMTLLFVGIFVMMYAIFFGAASLIGGSLITEEGDKDWLYFAMMGIMTLLLGVFGSVFNTYAGLYQAKDNELLMSMPIRARDILLMRVSGVFFMSALYSSMVWIPAVIRYWLQKVNGFTGILYPILMFVALTLLVTVLTCVLGWLVALVAGRTKRKSVLVVVLSLLFFAIYYYVCFRLNYLMQLLVQNSTQIGAALHKWVYPIYLLGMATTGRTGPMLLVLVGSVLAAVLCIAVLSKSFLSLSTMKANGEKKAYRSELVKTASVPQALLRRELKRFLASPTYMLNAGFGIFIAPVVAILGIVKADTVRQLIDMLTQEITCAHAVVSVLVVGLVGMISSMNVISTPSVSLEGKTIWILQSMPINPWSVLQAKLKLHVRINSIPALFASCVLLVVVRAPIPVVILGVLMSVVTVWVMGALGLLLGLKMPNLTWVSEVAPIKQSLSVFLALFGGWLINVLLIGVFAVLREQLTAEIYLLICLIVFSLIGFGLIQWLKRKGSRIFSTL